jgi:hypothetical protein
MSEKNFYEENEADCDFCAMLAEIESEELKQVSNAEALTALAARSAATA